MKLEKLLKREDFSQILIDTLTLYFEFTSKWKGKIKWGEHVGAENLNFLVNERLNIIFPLAMTKEQLMPLVSEYSYHINPIRCWAQKLYIYFALNAGFRYLFSSGKLHITEVDLLPTNICILPGNHTIRIVNLDIDQCLVIKKTGFIEKRLECAVSARLAYPDMPGPKIIDSNIAEGWYSEERIFGLPTNRVKDVGRIMKSRLAAKEFLKKMHLDTKVLENSLNYTNNKFKAIDVAINSLPACYKESDLDYIKSAKSRLVAISANVLGENCVVQISQTHGDLQDANLLVPTDDSTRDVYIIDWEYAGKRCCHYDWFVYGLRSRSPNGLASRIELLLTCDSLLRSKIDWYDFSNVSLSRVKVLVVLFLIEEFLFRLEDTNLPKLFEIPVGFISFIKEVRIISDFDFD